MSTEQGLVVTEIQEQTSDMGGEEKVQEASLKDIEQPKAEVQEVVQQKETTAKEAVISAVGQGEDQENRNAQNMIPEKIAEASKDVGIPKQEPETPIAAVPVPVVPEVVSKVAEVVPEKVSEVAEVVPEKTTEVTQKTSEVAEVVSQKVAEATEAVPKKIPEVPVPVKVSEVAEAVPEQTAQVSEKVSEVAEAVPEQTSEVTQKVSEVAEVVPEKTSEVTQKVSEVAEVVPEKTSEIAQKVSEVAEAVPDKLPEVPGKVSEVVEPVPEQATQVSEKVLEVVEVVPEQTAQVSEKVSEVPEVVSKSIPVQVADISKVVIPESTGEESKTEAAVEVPEVWKSALEVPEIEAPEAEAVKESAKDADVATVVPPIVAAVQQSLVVGQDAPEKPVPPAPLVQLEEFKDEEVVEEVAVIPPVAEPTIDIIKPEVEPVKIESTPILPVAEPTNDIIKPEVEPVKLKSTPMQDEPTSDIIKPEVDPVKLESAPIQDEPTIDIIKPEVEPVILESTPIPPVAEPTIVIIKSEVDPVKLEATPMQDETQQHEFQEQEVEGKESKFVKESIEVEGESVPLFQVDTQDETDLSFHDANEDAQAMTDDEFQEVEQNGGQAPVEQEKQAEIPPPKEIESNKTVEPVAEVAQTQEPNVLEKEKVAVTALMEDIFTAVKQFSTTNEQQGTATQPEKTQESEQEPQPEIHVDQIIKEQEQVSQKFIEENVPALMVVPEPVEVEQPPTEEVREDMYVSEFTVAQSGDLPVSNKAAVAGVGEVILNPGGKQDEKVEVEPADVVKVEDVQPEIVDKEIESTEVAEKQEDVQAANLAVSGLVYQIFDSVESHAAVADTSEQQIEESTVEDKKVEEVEDDFVVVQKLSEEEQAAAAQEPVVVETVTDGNGDVHVKEMVDDMFLKLSTGSQEAVAMDEVYEKVIRQQTVQEPAPAEKPTTELDTAKEGEKEPEKQEAQQLEMRDSVDEIHLSKVKESQIKGRAAVRTLSGRGIIEALRTSFSRKSSSQGQDVQVESSGEGVSQQGVGVSQGSVETETGSEELDKMPCQCFPFIGKRKKN